jgi:hypothetical protein
MPMIARCRRSLLVALAALVAGFAPVRAEEKAKELELKPKWKKGDTTRYEMTKSQVRESDGKVTRKILTRTPVSRRPRSCCISTETQHALRSLVVACLQRKAGFHLFAACSR